MKKKNFNINNMCIVVTYVFGVRSVELVLEEFANIVSTKHTSRRMLTTLRKIK
jgi:hypothetical protein